MIHRFRKLYRNKWMVTGDGIKGEQILIEQQIKHPDFDSNSDDQQLDGQIIRASDRCIYFVVDDVSPA